MRKVNSLKISITFCKVSIKGLFISKFISINREKIEIRVIYKAGKFDKNTNMRA